ncbi:hypothetical protein ACHAQA_005586 [Verticillium albo-atrum]
MSSSNNLKGLNTRTHPNVPAWFFIVQLVVLALGLGIFIASAYCLSFFNGNAYAGAWTGSPGFLLFTAILIFIVIGSHVVLQRFFSQWYFRLAFIIGYAFTIIFLLSAWAWAASIAGLFLGSNCYLGFCSGPSNDEQSYGSSLAAGAALGALAWVLTIVLLVFYILASLKEGREGVAPAAADAELGHVGKEGHQHTVVPEAHQQQPYAPAQEPYPQDQNQPYPPQQAPYPPQQQH